MGFFDWTAEVLTPVLTVVQEKAKEGKAALQAELDKLHTSQGQQSGETNRTWFINDERCLSEFGFSFCLEKIRNRREKRSSTVAHQR
jgi:hypothetical protein